MGSSIIEHFSTLEDPRVERNKKHKLIDIIVLVISAVVSGAEGWEGIEEFGHNKLDWLRQYIPLENGIPSHDCIGRVISRISFRGFQECFVSWVNAVTEATDGDIVPIDGKVLRRSYDRKRNKNAIYLVNAWSNRNGISLGQVKVDDKSNEITAVPELLKKLEISGCIVTLDAMGCQRTHAQEIIAKGADYVLAVKGNQGHLHEAVEDFFTQARTHQFKHTAHEYFESTEQGHGRIEIRRHWVSEVLYTLPEPESWAGLKSIGMVERECHQGSTVTKELRYYINSIPADAQVFAKATREHWGVENQLHWVLDVVFREDDSRIRMGNAPEIMGSIRQLALNLFKREPSKLSIKKKQFKAALNDQYRDKVLFG